MAGTPVGPSSPVSAQNAPVGTGIAAVSASHPGFVRESPSGTLVSVGDGGSGAPLSNVFFIDQGSANPDEDGSTGAPFKTLTAGVAAGIALGVSAVTLLITPYNYTGEVEITTDDTKFSFIGLGGGSDDNIGARIPDIRAGGDCYFENVFQGSLNGIVANTPDFIELVYQNSSGLAVFGIEGGNLNVIVNGFSTTFNPNASNAVLNGPVQNVSVLQLNGGSVIAPDTTCSALNVTLRNGSVMSIGTLNCQNVALYSDSHITTPGGIAGDATGKVVCESSSVSGVFTGFLETSTFRQTKFSGVTNLTFPVSMDVDSYFSFFNTGGNTDSEITSLTANEPSCRIPRGDNNNFTALTGQGKVVIPRGVMTQNGFTSISTSDSVDKQILIFDSFANEGFTFEIHNGVDGTTLYTFPNTLGSTNVWRATIIVVSFLGNNCALFSVEPINWTAP